MRRPRPAQLLGLLLTLLAARGLAPEALDPWRAWVVFKEFARASAEDTDHASFARFVDIVEQDPVVADLLVGRALASRVSWVDLS
jgi:hypothetical protein